MLEYKEFVDSVILLGAVSLDKIFASDVSRQKFTGTIRKCDEYYKCSNSTESVLKLSTI